MSDDLPNQLFKLQYNGRLSLLYRTQKITKIFKNVPQAITHGFQILEN